MTQSQANQHNRMDVAEISELIRNAPIGSYIGADGSQILAERACNKLVLEENDILFRHGENTASFFLVEKGRLARVRDAEKAGRPSILHVLEPGDLVGELSFIDNTEHTWTVIALTPATVLQFKKVDIEPLITEHPKLMFDFMRAVIKRVHHTMSEISRQQTALSDYIVSGGKGRM